MEPESIKGAGGNALVALVSLVRHVIHPEEPVVAVSVDVEENYRAWLAEREKGGVTRHDVHGFVVLDDPAAGRELAVDFLPGFLFWSHSRRATLSCGNDTPFRPRDIVIDPA